MVAAQTSSKSLLLQKEKEMTVQCLHELFIYDPLTGSVGWKDNPRPKQRPDGRAGFVCRDGYVVIFARGKKYMAHRIAYAMSNGNWPTFQIDHIDRDKSNNRLENLREASAANNAANRIQKKKSLYPKGVVFHKRDQVFHGRIGFGSRQVHLGTFPTAELASEAYVREAKKLFGEYAAL